jgi:hypothetical protein
MPLLDSLEKHLGRFAIPGLIRYIVALNALVFLLMLLNPGYLAFLVFDRDAIAAGQVWRLVSWIFIPTTRSLLWIFFYLSFTWWVGESLEQTWGTFRLNAYYFLGWLGCTAAGLLFGINGGNVLLTLTLLLAVATMAPNLPVMLFGILPLKMKWIAVIGLLYPASLFLFGGLSGQAAVIVSLANYLLFFGPDLVRQFSQNRSTAARRAKFRAASHVSETLHRCEVCARTEVSNPELDFRVSADGHEYCSAHLPARKD